MIKSMTAYARHQINVNHYLLCWEVKSVNHRYLDISLRLPETLRFMENDLRAIVKNFCTRGKIEGYLTWQNEIESSYYKINEKMVKNLLKEGERVVETTAIANDLSLASLLNIPGMIQMNELPPAGIQEAVGELFKTTLIQLNESRKKEGQALAELIRYRLMSMQQSLSQAKEYATLSRQETKNKMLARLQQLTLEVKVEPSRIEQEIALQLMRLDVSEELDRLSAHIAAITPLLSSSESMGKRLDFFMQELNREANTLSAKSDCLSLTQCAIDMKVLIEQMREQIQNIE